MRHDASVKAILCLGFLVAAYAYADEATDRLAINRTVAALNDFPQRAALFAQDSDAPSELARLPAVRPWSSPLPRLPGDPALVPPADGPTVTISKDPWGEATINFPVLLPRAGILAPRIASGHIRFITPDVALADGDCLYDDGVVMRSVPLLFVMKREGENWKIASLRVLAAR
jgi:hypothetical protein